MSGGCDLGAGDGKYSALLHAHGMEVVAVDRKEPAQGAEGIDFIVSDIASWLPKLSDQEIFDGIFIKNGN